VASNRLAVLSGARGGRSASSRTHCGTLVRLHLEAVRDANSGRLHTVRGGAEYSVGQSFLYMPGEEAQLLTNDALWQADGAAQPTDRERMWFGIESHCALSKCCNRSLQAQKGTAYGKSA
jgi:hypothetical protein